MLNYADSNNRNFTEEVILQTQRPFINVAFHGKQLTFYKLKTARVLEKKNHKPDSHT